MVHDSTFDSIQAVDPQEKFKDVAGQDTSEFPKPSASPAKATRKRKTVSKPVNLETRISAQLISLNFFVQLSPFRGDALSVDEISALAHALNAQAQSSRRFKDALELALSVGSSGELLSVIMLIVVRRAANHGLIPEQFAVMAGGLTTEQEDVTDGLSDS